MDYNSSEGCSRPEVREVKVYIDQMIRCFLFHHITYINITKRFFYVYLLQEMTIEETEALAAIRRRKRLMLQEHRLKKTTADNKPVMPRKHDHDRQFNTGRMGRHLSSLGLDPSAAVARIRSRSASRKGRKRDRSEGGNDDAMDVDQHPNKRLRSRSRSLSRPHMEALPGILLFQAWQPNGLALFCAHRIIYFLSQYEQE